MFLFKYANYNIVQINCNRIWATFQKKGMQKFEHFEVCTYVYVIISIFISIN